MKDHVPPEWDKSKREEGERLRQVWEDFFSNDEPDHRTAPASIETPTLSKFAEARSRHEEALLRYPNVVGVSEGFRTRDGQPTGEPCLVVYVERKIPRDQLAESEILPSHIEGVPLDVVEIGEIKPLAE